MDGYLFPYKESSFSLSPLHTKDSLIQPTPPLTRPSQQLFAIAVPQHEESFLVRDNETTSIP